MPTLQLYDTLLRFPLFQCMGANELSQLVAGTRLDFVKLEAGSTLLRSGDRNSRLLMLTNGSLQAMTHAADKGYTVAEEIRPPFIVEPERLFGLHQMSATDYHALTDINLIAIDKAEVARLCERFMAFRLNMLNLLATKSQQLADRLWLPPAHDLSGRIARFVASRCITPYGRKEVRIFMERLADEMNDSRIDVSQALKAMRTAGLISTGRGKIVIEALERLTESALSRTPPTH